MHISQPPGAGNALGRIRFNFPNKFLVYQHDTPDKYLFARDKRAYSHGCMRVQNPLTYGEKLLSLVLPNEHYTEAQAREACSAAARSTSTSRNPIPVHLTYQTAFVDDDGKLQLREDVYGRDAKHDRDPQGQRAQGRRHRDRARAEHVVQAGAHAGRHVWRPSGGYSYGGGSNFFDWLFGGPQGRPYAAARGADLSASNGNGRYSSR